MPEKKTSVRGLPACILSPFMGLLLFFLPGWPLLGAAAGSGEEAAPRMTVTGTIRDAVTGETLLGATVYITELGTGAATNIHGTYSIRLAPGRYTLVYSFIGYKTVTRSLELRSSVVMDVALEPGAEMLDEVVIRGQRAGENIRSVAMSTVKMDPKKIQKIPALMGEVDVLKALQLLPGVQATSEGGSGFTVRGGNPDQNLILLDEATVYNASHLMGFFSVFNNDALKDVTLYKGDIPASAGGRLSSLLDVRMKDGRSAGVHATGGVGTISSRLTLEGPFRPERSSWMISGRRTYADLFLRLSPNEDINDNILYFYDLNGGMHFRVSEKDRISVSAYYGKDIFKNPDFRMGWGNETVSMRWNRVFSNRLFSNVSLLRSSYRYSLGIPEGEANAFDWSARIVDHGVKADLGFYPDPSSTIRFGASMVHHRFDPGRARGLGEETIFTEFEVPSSYALESGIYLSNEQSIGSRLNLKYGVRFSMFHNLGPGTVLLYNERFEVSDSLSYRRGRIYHSYHGLEPRMGVSYIINQYTSLKASYSRTIQYVHLATNSTAGTPLDIWFPSSPNVEPQIADQVAVGVFRNLRDHAIEGSVELYYKTTRNAIDFKDHAELLLNDQLEGELRFGAAEAYGLEFLLRKNEGRLSGWLAYTLSHAERRIREINNGKAYLSPYDRPHDISLVLNYELSERLSLSANWVYNTGSPVTFPTGRAVIGNAILPVYSDRNTYRMPDYHRLDLSVLLKGRDKPARRFSGEWNLSVYNAYARKNAWVINFVRDENDPDVTYAEMTYLFSIIPSITYNFKF